MSSNRIPSASIQGASILVVDDTPHNLQLLTRTLEKQSYKVRTAISGRMALSMAEMYSPDLILLDIRMPGMDGYEVCTKLKENTATCEIPVLFISASDNVAGKVEAFSVGGVDYINKPFELVEVLARVETHLKMRSLQKQLQEQNISLQKEISEISGVNHQLYDALRLNVQRQGFELYYQPIVNLISRKVEGFEALLRWYDPERGFISPAEFIPLAESTGLITPLGEWVIAESTKQLGIWGRKFTHLQNLCMNINVSAKQLSDPNLVDYLCQSVLGAKVSLSQVRIEITESAMIENQQNVVEVLELLKSLGIKICIDDFGTGYSSLRRLHDFPISVLKIDQSFIAKGEWVIVNAICQLAKALEMEVVPEGIETEEQLNIILKTEACDRGQGYYFAKPMKVSMIDEIMEKTSKRSGEPTE
jgi:diguanylate cyclase